MKYSRCAAATTSRNARRGFFELDCRSNIRDHQRFLFDDASGKIRLPDWYPKDWGNKANWKWMGGHGAVLYAELIHRDLPKDLLFAVAAAHFDLYWALEKDDEGLNPALREAAQIAKRQAPQMMPAERMAEW